MLFYGGDGQINVDLVRVNKMPIFVFWVTLYHLEIPSVFYKVFPILIREDINMNMFFRTSFGSSDFFFYWCHTKIFTEVIKAISTANR